MEVPIPHNERKGNNAAFAKLLRPFVIVTRSLEHIDNIRLDYYYVKNPGNQLGRSGKKIYSGKDRWTRKLENDAIFQKTFPVLVAI